MLAKVCSAAVNGIDAYPVEVEVNAACGETLIVIVSCNLPMARFEPCGRDGRSGRVRPGPEKRSQNVFMSPDEYPSLTCSVSSRELNDVNDVAGARL